MTLIYFSQTISSLLERLEFSYLLSIIIYSLIYFTYLLFFVIYLLIYFTYPRGILEEDCRQSIHNTTEAKHARSLERKKSRGVKDRIVCVLRLCIPRQTTAGKPGYLASLYYLRVYLSIPCILRSLCWASGS